MALATGCVDPEATCIYGWCWENPAGDGSNLLAVHSLSSSDVWAVGEAGAALHFNGVEWRRVESGTYVRLGALWGSSGDDLWAAPGFTSRAESLRHWDGHTWSEAQGTPGTGSLTGSARSNVWEATFGAVFRFDGSSWGRVGPRDSMFNGKAIWSAASDDTWTTGTRGGLLHWDGTAWTAAQLDPSESYWSLWGSSSTDVWALGSATLAHWDGASWALAPAPVAGIAGQLWGTSTTNVWALGAGSVSHWDGATWSSPEPLGSEVTAIGGTSASDVWAVGAGGTKRHWDGKRWSGRNEVLTQEDLLGIHGSGPNDVWAVGRSGAALHWNGERWSRSDPPLPEPSDDWLLNSVFSLGPRDAWAVGGAGSNSGVQVTFHWDGTAWTSVPNPAGTQLMSIWGSAPADIWAVTGFEFLHWDGTSWSSAGPLTTGASQLSGTAADDLWASGRSVWHWDGAAWTQIDTGSASGVIWARTRTDVWLVNDGMSHHWDGTRWTPIVIDEELVKAGTTGGRASIFGAGAHDVWVRTLSRLYHWDGKSWTYEGEPRFSMLWGTNGTVWGVGPDGAILTHR